MSEESTIAKKKKKPAGFGRWVKRMVLTGLLLVLILVVLGWVFLPRIAERVIRKMMAEAGMDGTELRVDDISWNSAVIQDVSLSGEKWSAKARRVKVTYDPYDLVKGRVESVQLDGLVAEVSLEKNAEDEEDAGLTWLHALPETFQKVKSIHAQGAKVLVKRGEKSMQSTLDLAIFLDDENRVALQVDTDDFKLESTLENSQQGEQKSQLLVTLKEIKPAPFMEMLEMVLDVSEPLIPEGFQIQGAELQGGILMVGEMIKPLKLDGVLLGVSYDGGEKPIKVQSDQVSMALTVDFGGSGELGFSGKIDRLAMPLDPSADFELKQKEKGASDFHVSIRWGDEPTQMLGHLANLDLGGTYDAIPVSITEIKADFTMLGEQLLVHGSMVNGGVLVPLNYQHTLTEPHAGNAEEWLLKGKMELGPIDHSKPMPMLNAISDIFDMMEFTGKSTTTMDFSTGSHQAFHATMTTKVRDADVSISEGKVKAYGVNGTFALHIIPLPDDAPELDDPSYYTLDFTAEKLDVETKDALDYDLHHGIDSPVVFKGKGRFGLDESILNGEVRGLTLHGEKEGKEIDFEKTAIQFKLKGDVLSATGETVLGGNKIPFTYWHEYKSLKDDEWDLKGRFAIKKAAIKTPIDNAGMVVEVMNDMSVSGNLAMKMDFTIGSQKDFDGVLIAGLSEGKIVFADDGPVIEGLNGGIHLTSMKKKQTKRFQTVTARKVTAFDIEMTRVRLDYKLLPSGDIALKNISLRALGGNIWIDPFTIPDGDEDYQFKVRAKRLDLAQLAKLFPDFNGSISGRVDGLIPIKSVKGEFTPGRGGLYLTPRTRAKLRYDAGDKFSAGLDRKTQEYARMKMLEDSLRNLDLKVLSIRLFDPRDKDKAIVLQLKGQAHSIPNSPPIILNINGFKPDDDTIDFFDLLLKHRDKLNFGL